MANIAVIGGGIAGIACAWRLARSGADVTLFESSGSLGGLGTFFEAHGRTFEKFYHCMLPSDTPLLGLLDELGLSSEIYWKPTTFAYANKGRLFPLNKALDLLKFKPLSFLDRIRVGITGAYGRMVSSKGLDHVTSERWLGRFSGKRAFATFWEPLLQAKFGDRYHEVPALWFWTRFNREKGDSGGERKGYIRGGYRRITDTFAEKFQQLGGEILLHAPVKQIDLDAGGQPIVVTDAGTRVFDQVIITAPPPALRQSLGPKLREHLPASAAEIDYQGVINHVLFLKRSLTPHYWVATAEPEYPFDGLVETSTLTDVADRGNRHVVYLTKYLHRTDARYAQDEAEIEKSWWQALKRLFPDLRDDDLESSRVFKAPYVEPLYTLGFSQKRPPEVLVRGKVYLCNSAQVYPVVTSWNGSVGQAEKTLAALAATTPQAAQLNPQCEAVCAGQA